MKRTWTIIGVSDVASSLKWYQSLFGQPETPPDHDDFGQILDTDGTVLLCLHPWGAHEHPSLMSPEKAPPGNGLPLFFRVDDFDMALKRAPALVPRFEEEPHVNRNTQTQEFSLRDPDGYYVTISALAAPRREGPARGGLTSACSRRRRAAESESHVRDVRAAEALFVRRPGVANGEVNARPHRLADSDSADCRR